MQMHVPTMSVMIVLAAASLALPIGWLSGRGDGMRSWAGALAALAAAHALFAARGSLPGPLAPLAGAVLQAAAYALLLLAVLQVQARTAGPIMLWWPVVAIAVILPILRDDILAGLLLVNAVFLLQALLIGRQLLTGQGDFPARGRLLILAGLAVGLVVAALRIVAALRQPDQGGLLFDPSGLRSAAYGAGLVSLILISTGFLAAARERADAMLKRVGMKDRLTDCWNRVWVEEAGQQEMARLKRYGAPASLILIELDHFAEITDRQGRLAAEEILKGLAEIAKASVRATDLPGHWGHGRFAVLLPASGFPEAVHIAERMQSSLDGRLFAGDRPVTASLGIAVGLSTDRWEDWLGRAERALAQAQAEGGNLARAEGLAIGDAYRLEPTAQLLRLSWHNSYDSGCDPLDAEHRSLFIEANRLLALGGESGRKPEILAAAQSLLADSRAHFLNEENLLERQGYAELTRHKAIHRHLLERFEMMLDRYRQDRIGPAELLHFATYELIAQHMLIEDRRFYPLFRPAAG